MTFPAAQPPAIVETVPTGRLAEIPGGQLVPALIADAGEQAAWRYIDFFIAISVTRTLAELMPARVSSSSPGAMTAA